MTTNGNKKLLTTTIKGLSGNETVVIVKTEWNQHIVDELENGCKKILQFNKVSVKTIVVPGAMEIPFTIQRHFSSTKKIDAYIALGCVIKGDTPHFDYVCQGITQGVTLLNTQLKVPVIFGVLTVNNEQQANERIGGKHGHKGEEAAITALKMISLNNKVALNKK